MLIENLNARSPYGTSGADPGAAATGRGPLDEDVLRVRNVDVCHSGTDRGKDVALSQATVR